MKEEEKLSKIYIEELVNLCADDPTEKIASIIERFSQDLQKMLCRQHLERENHANRRNKKCYHSAERQLANYNSDRQSSIRPVLMAEYAIEEMDSIEDDSVRTSEELCEKEIVEVYY